MLRVIPIIFSIIPAKAHLFFVLFPWIIPKIIPITPKIKPNIGMIENKTDRIPILTEDIPKLLSLPSFDIVIIKKEIL